MIVTRRRGRDLLMFQAKTEVSDLINLRKIFSYFLKIIVA